MSEARTLWEEGREPGRQVVALALALALTVVMLDVTMGGDLGMVFDSAFVCLCVAVALLVHPADFFTVGVLPPLIMLVVVVLVAVARPRAFVTGSEDLFRTVVAGLSQHAVALGVGYALCLGLLAVRDQYLRSH